ncbi:MAG: transglycosylase domain-containing protein [Bradymonadia bacterium]
MKALRVLGTLLKYAVLVLVSLGLYGAAAAVYVARTLDAEVDALKAELGPQVEAVRAMKATRPGWAFPSTVYTDWFVLAEGAGYGVQRVAREAVARGYERVTADAPLAPGQLREVSRVELHLGLRGFDFPDCKVGPVELKLKAENARLTTVEVSSGTPWSCPYRLEPLYMDTWVPESNELRTFVPLAGIPQIVRDAIVASEDERFREHPGLDVKGILRAARRNVLEGQAREGASTLTQQVVRTFFLSRERSLRRKVNEALRALALERILEKDSILELYLNSVYLGQVQGRSIGGFGAGARAFFDQPLERLSLDQVATLVAVVPAPVAWSPFKNPELTQKKRARVLDKMAELGFVSREEAAAAQGRPIVLKPPAPVETRFPLWSQWARRWLTETFAAAGMSDPANLGLRIFTSVSPAMQTAAELGVAQVVEELEKDFGLWRKDPLQGAAVGLDPRTGLVEFAVAGRGTPGDQFHRAVQARRQPGSAMKPVAYAAVLEVRDEEGRVKYPPVTTVEDTRRSWDTPEGKWSPRNSDGLYHPWVTMAKAFAKSMNVATTHFVMLPGVGPQAVVDMATRMGIRSEIKPVASVALGGSEVTAVELTAALSSAVTGGLRVDYSPVRGAFTARGEAVWTAPTPSVRAMEPTTAGMLQGLMKNSYERGTGYMARIELGVQREVIGKTGTSQQGRDLWFVGVARNLAIAFWVGHDRGRPIDSIAGESIAPAWGWMAKPLFADVERQPLEWPESVELLQADPFSGCRGGGFPVAMPRGQPWPKCRPIDWEIPKREKKDEDEETRSDKKFGKPRPKK